MGQLSPATTPLHPCLPRCLQWDNVSLFLRCNHASPKPNERERRPATDCRPAWNKTINNISLTLSEVYEFI